VDAGWLASLGLAAAVSVGAGTQRITGLGFALVAAPFLVLLLGPFTGVLVVNVLGVAASVLVLAQVRRDVDLRRGVLLSAPALVAVVPGAWVARHGTRRPAGPRGRLRRRGAARRPRNRPAERRAPRVRDRDGARAGRRGGVGLHERHRGGRWARPHGLRSRDPLAAARLRRDGPAVLHRRRYGLGGGQGPAVPARRGLVVTAAALVVGLGVGTLLAARVSPTTARTAALALALVGSVATVVDGVLGA
jgi:uncharacterized protein